MQRLSTSSFTKIVVSVVVAVVIGIGGYFIGVKYPPNSLKDNQKVSTAITPPVEPSVKSTDITSSPGPSTNSMDKTASWKMYENSNYNFTLKYPSDWDVTDSIQASGESTPNNSLRLHPKSNTPNIMLVVNHGGYDSGYPEKQYDLSYSDNKLIISGEKINKSSDKDTFQPTKGSIQFLGDIEGNKYFIQVTDVDNQSSEDLVKQIISTLKFSR